MRSDRKVLLLNADDFGIYPSANQAVINSIDHDLAASCSLMVPSPGAPEALRILADRSDIAFGIHLTLVADFPTQRWKPLTGGRSLLDSSGQLFTPHEKDGLLASARIEEVEAEFRAQIEVALEAGLSPTHLDWHCLADGGRGDVFDLTLALADEYGLAVRAWLEPAQRKIRARSLPVVDHGFLDSFSIELEDKALRYARLLRGLPRGLTEWAVHPAYEHALDSGSRIRRSDYDFLVSAEAREIIEEEEISVIGWSAMAQQWLGHHAN
ncbi:MAG: ChbG/HpnK family deacetylase [Propionibacteriales bacterium]|nr:ChbG/HpnK family deacetylase [Propionibacteriales bacterium]